MEKENTETNEDRVLKPRSSPLAGLQRVIALLDAKDGIVLRTIEMYHE